MSQEDKLAVIAHGFADDYFTPWWRPVEEKFNNWGYKTKEIGFDGILKTVDSPQKYANQLQDQIDEKVEGLEKHGYDEVIVVGHSMGGLTTRYFMEELGYDDQVDSLITFGTPHQGTDIAKPFSALFDGAKDLSTGSNFIQDLNRDGVSEKVNYLNIYTEDDPMISPYDNAKLPESGNVTNIEVGESFQTEMEQKAAGFMKVGVGVADDLIETNKRLFKDSLENPLKLVKPNYWKDLPTVRNRKVRYSGLRSELHRTEVQDFLTGHLGMLYNDEAWKKIAEYLDEENVQSEDDFLKSFIEDSAVSLTRTVTE